MPAHDDTLEDLAAGEIHLLLHACANRIADNESDPGAFLAWARVTLPALAHAVGGAKDEGDEDDDRFFFWLAFAIWNAMPLERNRYRPLPLPPPQRNARCPCGSGRKYKQCCRDIPKLPAPPEEIIWSVLIETRPVKHWLHEVRAGSVPVVGMLVAVEQFVEQQRWRAVKDLAEIALGEDIQIRDRSLALLVDPLCDAYDELYRTDRKKQALLERLATHRLDSIQAAANQRLAGWLQDQGEREAASAALGRAIRAAPDDPGNAALEISLLAGEQAYDRAAQRAGFWLRRLRKLADVPEETLAFLDAVQHDAAGTLAGIAHAASPQPVGALYDWYDQHTSRPVPQLFWSALPADSGDDDEADSWLIGAHEPLTTAAQDALVHEWQSRSDMSKPFSVQWYSGDEEESWAHSDEWLPWLESHPEALDSLDILDDLIALSFYADDAFGLFENPWLDGLLDRGVDMLLRHWPEERAGTLPWIINENRPALRILARAIIRRQDKPDARIWELTRCYLHLNPSDNHGFRHLLVNELLRSGRDEEALALAGQYPGDIMPEIAFGRVLALFRQGRPGEAIDALMKAAADTPLVLDYLLRDKVAKPVIDPHGVTIGGKDQAWLYRDAMRATWMATEGLTEWLKAAARKVRKRSR